MATPRRRIIRPTAGVPQPDPARQRRLQKLRSKWLAEHAALERWWKRLRRAFNAIEKHQRSIKSLDKQLAQNGQHANGQDH